MKRKSKILLGVLLLLVFGVIGIGINVSAASTSTIAYKKDYSNTIMKVGSKARIYVVNKSGKEISASKIKWESSHPAVATIENGVIKANKYGKTYISAQLKNSKSNSVKFMLRVYKSRKKVSITNIDENYVLKVGKVKKIVPSVKASYCKFTSSDPSVVTVSSKGGLKGIKAGKATITYLTVG